ncbi:MAG: hypothetical protein NC924_02385 [Candidatus Omnitrophica bacterium]|nr:hypothetical protein [Candidatus Omnitrophota bacterium]
MNERNERFVPAGVTQAMVPLAIAACLTGLLVFVVHTGVFAHAEESIRRVVQQAAAPAMDWSEWLIVFILAGAAAWSAQVLSFRQAMLFCALLSIEHLFIAGFGVLFTAELALPWGFVRVHRIAVSFLPAWCAIGCGLLLSGAQACIAGRGRCGGRRGQLRALVRRYAADIEPGLRIGALGVKTSAGIVIDAVGMDEKARLVLIAVADAHAAVDEAALLQQYLWVQRHASMLRHRFRINPPAAEPAVRVIILAPRGDRWPGKYPLRHVRDIPLATYAYSLVRSGAALNFLVWNHALNETGRAPQRLPEEPPELREEAIDVTEDELNGLLG